MKTNEIKCCTPNGQIKRYKDCIGCDRNPLELNQNKMTAVEWLVGDLIKKGLLTLSGDTLKSIGNAKEMEEQEKIDFADKYGTYLLQGGIMSAAAYNETFKSE